MEIPEGDLDLLAIGETLVDFISVEETDWLRNAYTFRKYQGGSPANIAVYVAKVGGKAAVVSKTGIGAMGQFLKAELGRAGVVTDYMVMDHRVHSSVIFVSRTSRTADFEAFRSGDYQLEPKEISQEAIDRAKVVHASTWALSREPCRSAVEHAFSLAREQGKIISLDPNYSPQIWPDYREAMEVMPRLLGYATITKPSLDDASRLFGRDRKPEEYVERFHEMGPEIVVLTMGAEGVLLSEGGKPIHIPARPVKAVDATGAGDSFWAGFLVALLDGNPPERCVLFAREIVERKLRTVGPLPDSIDRQEIYGIIDAAGQEDREGKPTS
ncbi:MAG: carbohydrate kinase [Anaerolineae bacterium]|jgi:sugar/nucleoside kinase (ribokinase family)